MQSPLSEKSDRERTELFATRKMQEEAFLECIADLKGQTSVMTPVLTGAAIGALCNTLFRSRQMYQFVFGGMITGMVYSRYQITKQCSEKFNYTRDDRRRTQEYLKIKTQNEIRNSVGMTTEELDFNTDFDREINMLDSDYGNSLDSNMSPTEEASAVPPPKVTYDDLRRKNREENPLRYQSRIPVQKSTNEQVGIEESEVRDLPQRKNKYGDPVV